MIEVLNLKFDIDVSSISDGTSTASISKFQASISKILRYHTGSISNVTTFDIDVSQAQPTFDSDIEGCTFDIRARVVI